MPALSIMSEGEMTRHPRMEQTLLHWQTTIEQLSLSAVESVKEAAQEAGLEQKQFAN